jgi:hypothetical protein
MTRLEKITHAKFQQMVVDLAKLNGWKVQYWWKSIRSPAGFPDLYCVKIPYQVFLELKIKPDKPKPAQLEWIEILRQLSNTKALVVYPDDWDKIIQIFTNAL